MSGSGCGLQAEGSKEMILQLSMRCHARACCNGLPGLHKVMHTYFLLLSAHLNLALNTCLPAQETMPAVTLFCSVSGLPRASTHSPTRISLLLPSFTTGRDPPASILTIAKSDTLSKGQDSNSLSLLSMER